MKVIRIFFTILCFLISSISFSQTQTIVYVTNTTDWLAFNGNAAQAGNGWNTLSFPSQGWVAPFNGLGQTGSQTCLAPYSVPANQSNNPLGVAVPVIWTRQNGNPSDAACFRRIINIQSCGRITSATIDFGSDDIGTLFINGVQVGTSNSTNGHTRISLNTQQACQTFINGDNVIAAEVIDNRGACMGFHFGVKLIIDTTDLATSLEDITQSPANSNLGVLEQNYPNPFSDKTEISYQLPLDFKSAEIIIMDITGKLLKTFEISQKGKGKILVNSSEFQSGLYIYSLVVNGKKVDSKKMKVFNSK